MLCALALSGCGAALVYGGINVIGVPIDSTLVTRAPNGQVSVYKGTVHGRQIGGSTIELKKEGTDTSCEGTLSSDGEGAITCSDGANFAMKGDKENYGKMSGAYAGRLPDGTVFASGWGKNASDTAALRQMLPK
jgi:hypothetical protein